MVSFLLYTLYTTEKHNCFFFVLTEFFYLWSTMYLCKVYWLEFLNKSNIHFFQILYSKYVLKLIYFLMFLQSEYIAPCDNRRAFVSGFTGSAGTYNTSAHHSHCTSYNLRCKERKVQIRYRIFVIFNMLILTLNLYLCVCET